MIKANEIIGELAKGIRLFRTQDKRPFAKIQCAGHTENVWVNSPEFEGFVVGQTLDKWDTIPSRHVLREIMGYFAGRATLQGDVVQPSVRVAGKDGKIYVDLADEQRRVVEISEMGVTVLAEAPPEVFFIRTTGMLPLPVPDLSGTAEVLRKYVNLPSESLWHLYYVATMALFRPRGPHIIVFFYGEQGCGKTLLSKITRMLTDPSIAPVRMMSRNSGDLTVSALNCHVLVLENVSYISPEFSDYLCQITSGFGASMREYYTNTGEIIVYLERPIIINSIEETCTRGDLLDRSIPFILPALRSDTRKSEDEIWSAFKEDYAKIFGGLLNALSGTLRELPKVKHKSDDRLLDFVRFGIAAERALSWSPGSFLSAYSESRLAGRVSVLETCIFADFIRRLADFGFNGSATKLLDRLENSEGKDFQKRRHTGFPKTPHQLSGILRRFAPAFRSEGVEILIGKTSGTNSQRFIRIERVIPLPLGGSAGVPCDAGDAGVAPVQGLPSNFMPTDQEWEEPPNDLM